MEEPAYFLYWGKAHQAPQHGGDDYHLLPYHSLDVAAVGQQFLHPEKPLTCELAAFLNITPSQLNRLFTFALALHDLGKFSSAFQALYQPPEALWLPNCRRTYDGSMYRHDRLGLFFWEVLKDSFYSELSDLTQYCENEQDQLDQTLLMMLHCVFGHHGQPVENAAMVTMKKFTEPHNLDAAGHFVHDAYHLIQPDIPLERLIDQAWGSRLAQVSWQLAGIAVLADWIGSNQVYFQYQCQPKPLCDYWHEAQVAATEALKMFGLSQNSRPAPFQSVEAHFHFQPTPLQQWAEEVPLDDAPQLFVLEDVTGSGKTEAALVLTHRLMSANAADGFYFGLPTMATSNAMFDRIADYYQQMFVADQDNIPSIVLAHAAREMNERFQQATLESGPRDTNYAEMDRSATAQCSQWLADSRKKALLAPVGVGTIDQALLAVLPRRHQSLRLLGLHRKVLIFDEIHTADDYMFELLEALLRLHLHQGGSAILLTATLSLKQRQRLADIWLNTESGPHLLLKQTHFPLATQLIYGNPTPVREQPLASRADVSRAVQVDFVHHEQVCIERIVSAVEQGQCVVWVRNSVDDALAGYRLLNTILARPDDCLLFHSRFILNDRRRIETQVLQWFGKKSTGLHRQGKVLIATQVFQESLDADADVMISDLCPIDDLIQRAGRLHRHTRNESGCYMAQGRDQRSAPILYVHAPEWEDEPAKDWLSRNFRNTEFVYRSPGRLWLGQRILRQLEAIRMPEQARQLIEAVYGDTATESIPTSLQSQEEALMGDECAKANRAWSQLIDFRYGYHTNSSQYWTEDHQEIGTRYSDVEMVSVLLLKQTENGQFVPWVDDAQFAIALSTVKVGKKKFADHLVMLSEVQTDAVHRAYPTTKYLQLWMPETDPLFTYDETAGFCAQQKQEVR
ncbi:CRISPR-associated helicase/endonuclease Cas3 [Vibrio spartinae]|uniref:CRISPR-associated endonuclease/helicase Cas3 n=1 Tax=Vibrio spartinae TaxID=1918945 RepID=A0A1N6LZ08_9VIBR|nr:CRISPR-associated helicase/endonuclease Cas3 [Vibrio spartinae]SIO92410.1 CRISPR-associated endonuclease/helicase Cas3 [Vibrio spartinae]